VNGQVEWYCRHLGFRQIASDNKTPPAVLLGYEEGGPMIEVMPVRDAGPSPAETPRFQPGFRHLALRVSDFDEAYRRLKNLGVKFLFEPIQPMGGGKLVAFRDPEGNELQIVQRNEKSK
jgi:catechol 2,3-dioxygenase-like lactoylglutathione lyase family enzyme